MDDAVLRVAAAWHRTGDMPILAGENREIFRGASLDTRRTGLEYFSHYGASTSESMQVVCPPSAVTAAAASSDGQCAWLAIAKINVVEVWLENGSDGCDDRRSSCAACPCDGERLRLDATMDVEYAVVSLAAVPIAGMDPFMV